MFGGKPEPSAAVIFPTLTTPGFIFNVGVNSPPRRSVACADRPPAPRTSSVAVSEPARVTVAETWIVHGRRWGQRAGAAVGGDRELIRASASKSDTGQRDRV